MAGVTLTTVTGYHGGMKPLVHLSSPKNAQVKAVVRLRTGRHRRKAGLFIAEGWRQIERAIAAELEMVEFFWCRELLGDETSRAEMLYHRCLRGNTELAGFTVDPGVFERMAYLRNPAGVLAVFRQRQWDLEAVLSKPTGADPGLWLVAVSIEKPGNLGAMARTAAAAGALGMLVADSVVDPVHPNALAASTGAVLRLPIVASSSEELITALQARDIRIIAATPDGGQGASSVRVDSYLDVDLTGPVAIAIGPEDKGLGSRWLSPSCEGAAAELVSIPMPGRGVDSLNAAAAAAVLLFEAARQRQVERPPTGDD